MRIISNSALRAFAALHPDFVKGEELLKQQLTGLIWAYLPYVMPGIDLANAISEHPLFGQCEIFILKNHGLITCGKDAETAYRLTLDVLKRCQTPVRPFAETNFSRANSADNSKQFINDYYWANHQQIHSLVLDPISLSYFDQRGGEGRSLSKAAMGECF